MNLKRLSTLTLLISGLFFLANAANAGIIEHPEQQMRCDFDTPTNFGPGNIGTNSVELEWTQPGDQPPFYNLKTIRAIDGATIFNETFANSHTGVWKVNNLVSGTAYNFELRPVNSQMEICTDPALTSVTTVILDLVVLSFGPNNSTSSQCVISVPNQKCNFPAAGETIFKLWKKENKSIQKEFRVRKIGSFNYRVRINEGIDFTLLCGNNSSGAPCSGGSIEIHEGAGSGTLLATFTIEESPGTGTPALVCTYLYKYNNIYPYEFAMIETFQLQGNEQPELKSEPLQTQHVEGLQVSPNPFRQSLDVQIDFADETKKTRCYLYDAQGRQIRFQELPEGTDEFRLSTEHLLPGCYFLRVEGGNKTVSTKVIKTQ